MSRAVQPGPRACELQTDVKLDYPVIAYTDNAEGPTRIQSLAVAVAVKTIEENGRWVRYARAHRPFDGNPGDCLYVPPACLLDFDEAAKRAARRWRLAVGVLTTPEGDPLFHTWLEYFGQVVSVSNLRIGYPAYVMEAERYYEQNGLQSEVLRLSPRSMRGAARHTGGGNALARWIRQRWTTEMEGRTA